jgi:hypothetical protein
MRSRTYYRVRSVVRFVFALVVTLIGAALVAWLLHLIWVAIGVN